MLDRYRAERRLKRLYTAAVRLGLTDLGMRMRNETAVRCRPGEVIVEDDPVLVTDTQQVKHSRWTAQQWGWLVLTSQRARWAQVAESRVREARLDDLELVYSEGDFDTYRWGQGRKASSVTFGFLRRNDVRQMLSVRAASATDEQVVDRPDL